MSLLRHTVPLAVLVTAACTPPPFSPTELNLPESVSMEEGDVQTIPIALETMPRDDVTVLLTSSDDSKVEIVPASLIFTTENWGEGQNITLSALEDDTAAEPAAVIIELELTSGGSQNEPLRDAFRVDIEDNDTAGVWVQAAANLETHELETSVTFSIALTSKPFAAVTIPLSTSDITEGAVSPAELHIKPNEWANPHVVTVTGVAEPGLDRDVEYTIRTGITQSEDPAYEGLDPDDVSLLNRDFTAEEFEPPELGNSEDAPVAGVSADGELVVFVNAGQAVVWNPRSGGEQRFGANVRHAALASNGKVLAYTEASPTVSRLLIVDDLASGESSVAFSAEATATIRGLSLSQDGRFVAFETDASALTPDGSLGSVVVHDTLGTDPPVRVDAAGVGGLTIDWSGSPSISDDGNVIAFEASVETMGGPHILLWREGAALVLASSTPTVKTTEVTSSPVVSGDGRVVVFSARADFTQGGETTQRSAAYAFDVTNESLKALTAGMPPEPLIGYSPTVSAEGNVVAFESEGENEGAPGGEASSTLMIHKRATRDTRRVDLSDSGKPVGGRCSAVAPPSSFLAFLCEDDDEITLHFVEIGDAFWQSAAE